MNKPAITASAAVYWITTIVTAFVLLSAGVMSMLRNPAMLDGMRELGYPAYFVTILGVWKLLGGVAILAPRFGLLKEWAYAGIAFDFSGAAISHAALSHPPIKVLVPLIFLFVAAVSWALRPASRKVGTVNGAADAERT